MLRISTTTLESFRLFMDPEQDWMPEQELIDSIKGVFVGNANTERGYAFGRILEDPERFREPGGFRVEVDRKTHKALFFEAAWVERCLACVSREGVFEVKRSMSFEVPGVGVVDVVAKVDHLHGRHITEFKNTTSTFNIDKYLESEQWRFYSLIFDAPKITYQVFELSEASDGTLDLRACHDFNVYAYPNMRADCEETLAEFCDYVRRKNLTGYLAERARQAA
jgi:hypothetical protein